MSTRNGGYNAFPSPGEIVELDQEILRDRVEAYQPPVETYFKRPYLVWTGMPTEFIEGRDLTGQDGVPEVLRRLGAIDGTTYPYDRLKAKYEGGGLIVQPNGKGGLEAYPVTLRDIDRNTRLSSPEDALSLNPELAKLLAASPELSALVLEGNMIGMVKSVPTRMIKFSDIGYQLHTEVILPGKGDGQRKTAGEDAYLGISQNGEGQPVYWIINADHETSLPVNHMPPEAFEQLRTP